jgi:hypothetical protein
MPLTVKTGVNIDQLCDEIVDSMAEAVELANIMVEENSTLTISRT